MGGGGVGGVGGGGGGGSLSIKAGERCIKFSISIPILIISDYLLYLQLEMYLSIVRGHMNVFVCGHMHENIVISWHNF